MSGILEDLGAACRVATPLLLFVVASAAYGLDVAVAGVLLYAALTVSGW